MIFSESKLDDEVEFITETLCNNGFPEDIVRSVIRDKISDFSKIKPDSVQRCPAYLRLFWLDVSDRFGNQISAERLLASAGPPLGGQAATLTSFSPLYSTGPCCPV